MKVWILTKGTDIDPSQILGVFDRELGYERFAIAAAVMHKESQSSFFGPADDEDGCAFNPLAAATHGDDDSLYLAIRADVLTLTPHDYTTKAGA